MALAVVSITTCDPLLAKIESDTSIGKRGKARTQTDRFCYAMSGVAIHDFDEHEDDAGGEEGRVGKGNCPEIRASRDKDVNH